MIHIAWRGWGVLAWLFPCLLFPVALVLVHEWDPNLAEKRTETIAVGIANMLGAVGLHFAIDYLKKIGKYNASDMFMFIPLRFMPYVSFGIGVVLLIFEFAK